jgi:WD40 repeat protein
VEAHIGPVKSLAWNFDGSKLLSCDYGIEAGNQGTEDLAHLKIWDQGGNLANSMLVTNQPLSHASWSPDGKRVVAGSWRSVTLWTIGDRRSTARWLANMNGVVPVAWRPTGDLIAAGPLMLDGNGQPQRTVPLREITLTSAGLNSDGTILGIGRADRTFDLLNSNGEQLFHSRPLGNNNLNLVHSICWNPDGKTFIPGMRYHAKLQTYDAKGNPAKQSYSLPGDARSIAWSRDGKYLATGGDNLVVSLVNLETSRAVPIGKQNHGITQVRFTPDQQQVCSAGFDGCVRFWSLDGKPLKVLETISAPIDSLAWSSDGQLMVTGHQDNTIRFWTDNGEQVTIVGGHGGHVEVLEFNPAGTLLASGSRDNSIRIWNRDGTPVATLQGHSGAVHGIQWTPDGSGIYSCAADGTIRFWNVESGVTEWQSLLGEAGGYVTLDGQGRFKHGDEQILNSDFVFFAEDHQHRLRRTAWTEIRAAAQTQISARSD